MDQEIQKLRLGCTRALNWHGTRDQQSFLKELVDEGIDRYGDAGAVVALEEETSRLLGKRASVFMPSGTMAQQIALRIHADRRGTKTVALHPTAHLELHEDDAYRVLHGIDPRKIGDGKTLITTGQIAGITEPLAAFLFELPQREIGGRLPEWDDIVEQTALVRERGAAVHLDGARLWECTPYYGKPLHEIAALFDTVYVSFYKGLGGVSGSCLSGEPDVIAEARVWRHRHGGTLWSLWPLAASGLGALRTRLDRMQQYYEHARAIAATAREIDGIDVVPDPPQTPMMHLSMRTTAERFMDAVEALAREESIWTWSGSSPSDNPNSRIAELTVGDATLGFTPGEVATILQRFVR